MDLREYLFRKRISKKDFAEKVGTHRNYIGQIALKHKKPGKFLAKAIVAASNGAVTMDELMNMQIEEQSTSHCA